MGVQIPSPIGIEGGERGSSFNGGIKFARRRKYSSTKLTSPIGIGGDNELSKMWWADGKEFTSWLDLH